MGCTGQTGLKCWWAEDLKKKGIVFLIVSEEAAVAAVLTLWSRFSRLPCGLHSSGAFRALNVGLSLKPSTHISIHHVVAAAMQGAAWPRWEQLAQRSLTSLNPSASSWVPSHTEGATASLSSPNATCYLSLLWYIFKRKR